MKNNFLHSLVFGFVFVGSMQAMDPAEKQIVDENKYDKCAREYYTRGVKILGNQNPISFMGFLDIIRGGGIRSEQNAFPEELKQWASRCKQYSSNNLGSISNQDIEALLYECLHPVNKLMNDAVFIKNAINDSSSRENSSCVAQLLYVARTQSEAQIIRGEGELKYRQAMAAAAVISSTSTKK